MLERKNYAKQQFKNMLQDHAFINTGMRFRNLVPIFQNDP